ncbi:MAG TPA: endonuclease/exonuclease/phosphatase family protein, partial [Candidatus Limnocylindrales bacterium]
LVARFPHRLLHPDDSVLGMGLLSIHPLTERSNGRNPPHVHADMRLRDGLTVSTLVGHPLPPKFGTLFDVIPTGYVASERDASISLLRVKVASDLAAGTPVIVLGDFNVTDREPAYHDLTAGLKDAHLEVGFGPGSTWRPARFAGVPLGVLRIDYVLVGGAVRPLTVAADCASSGSDHCIVESTLAVASP